MVNYLIYAKDCSGSTEDIEFYHSNGLKTLEQFKHDVERIKEEMSIGGGTATETKIIYLHWGDNCWTVDEDETRNAYLNMYSARMGTKPETIIKFLKKEDIIDKSGKIKLLYIITDGLIGSESANKCFKLNEDMHYETVVFHALNEDLESVDISVAASFFKSRCIIYRNNDLYESTNISEKFDYDKINSDNFVAEKDQLKSYIRLKFLRNNKNNAVALEEIKKLKKLRDRLFNELSLKGVINENKQINLETKDKNRFLREFVKTDWYKDLIGSEYDDKVDVEKFISTLINYIVSDAKSYSFDALKLDMKFNKSVEEEQMDDVTFTAEEEIEFPDIILGDETGIPVIILAEVNLMDKIIFHNEQFSKKVSPASFSKFKSTIDCPLFLVQDKDISESIGYFYTLSVYKQLLAKKITTEPRTRKPFRGGIVLTETDQFDKYNDYILSSTYFNCKKVNYNVGLFYFVLWKNCENKEWMDKNVIELFKKYTMRRISETICKIGLSCLPLDPHINTSLPTALWYCTELSSHIFKNDPQNFKHERLRMYHGVVRYMIEILKYFEYDLDLHSIDKRSELIKHVSILKRIPVHREKVYFLLEKIFKTVDVFLVSKIENPLNLYVLNYLKLNHKDMLVDKVVEEKVDLNRYIHLMNLELDSGESKTSNDSFDICQKTFRPYFAIDKNKSFYSEVVKNTRKVVIKYDDDDKNTFNIAYEKVVSLELDRILSLYKLFIDCVDDLGKYPNLIEYTEYVFRKKKFHEDLITVFPSNVILDIKNVHARYQKIITNVEVNEFIKTSKTCVTRCKRIKAEERIKFSSDDKILDFICGEEKKVDLKKNIHSTQNNLKSKR